MSRYIYINPETNAVHLLMPIMSGSEIGRDNTCKSVYSLQEFFGLAGANKQNAAIGVLTDYKVALEFDLKYMPVSEEKTRKTHRLSQINTYLEILNQIQHDTRITQPLMQQFPLYPEPLEHLMQANESNLHSIILRPRNQDNYLRTTAILPTFSANHDEMVNGQLISNDSILADTLWHNYQSISFTTKSKEGLIARVVAKRAGLPVNFDEIRKVLIDEIKTYLGITVKFDETQSTRYAPSVPMNKSYTDEQLAIDADNPATTQDYVHALIEYCTPNLFDNVEGSPFYTVNDSEHLSLLTQFFLAELNITCKEQGITTANFGQTLEGDAKLVQDLGIVVKDALEHSAPVEEALIEYINQHQAQFGLTTLISEESMPALTANPTLKEQFKSHWEQIKASPHFDEFMRLSKKKGLFVTHQSFISTHFAHFLNLGWQDNRLDAQLHDFNTVNKPDNVIPHKNEQINADIKVIEIDLSNMDKDAMLALYEDINTYPDKVLEEAHITKEALLLQLKAERPDFKPKIDAKQFLQHVAYGEQDEAEALLLKDPELAQELLRTDKIPFMDYSGRTFNCTAYEYAYWAKDSHMQRMLEKYIRINEDTRQLIEKRAQDITKPVPSAGPSGFLGRLFGLATKPQGLHYTTKDKQGNIIEHQDAGFDLAPLINALNHYVAEYNKKSNKTEADWDVLEKIWIEEVGRAQRDVPAHIAQEYCHPERSFDEVNKNKDLLDASNPANLKRQLKFYNYDTANDDVWFSPNSYSVDSGLGFSFGILRWDSAAAGMWWLSVMDTWRAVAAVRDSTALAIIGKVRTKDREQSLLNLSQPLNRSPNLTSFSQ